LNFEEGRVNRGRSKVCRREPAVRGRREPHGWIPTPKCGLHVQCWWSPAPRPPASYVCPGVVAVTAGKSRTGSGSRARGRRRRKRGEGECAGRNELRNGCQRDDLGARLGILLELYFFAWAPILLENQTCTATVRSSSRSARDVHVLASRRLTPSKAAASPQGTVTSPWCCGSYLWFLHFNFWFFFHLWDFIFPH
jgi:hypothetical protein